MIKYGLDRVMELKFVEFRPVIEKRDEQWIDIVLHPVLDKATPIPDDLIQFSALVICTLDGTVVQMVPQDEDCDCEYQFTFSEKEQIKSFVESEEIQQAIQNLSSPV
ncbi:hypothetical protein ACFQZE_03570 [Paenibacillus sp. GCM10027627]|uniref:hypothetical protein n=1 Tax=unclassified Paenibacillus TaxID=185978 RepID=UPI003624EEB8